MNCYGINIHHLRVVHRQEYELRYNQFQYCLYSYSQSNQYSPKGQMAGTIGYLITGEYYDEQVMGMTQAANLEMSIMALLHGLQKINHQHHSKRPAHILIYVSNGLLKDIFTKSSRINDKSAIKHIKRNLELIKLLDHAFQQFKVSIADYPLSNDNLMVDKIKHDVQIKANQL